MLVICLAVLFLDAAATSIVFPDDAVDSREQQTPNDIPLDKILWLNSLANISELIPDDVIIDDVVSLASHTSGKLTANYQVDGRFGNAEEVDKAAAVRPEMAKCRPEPEVVSLSQQAGPNVLVVPSCTRVRRCGGCCGTRALRCQPTDMAIINFQVNLFTWNGEDIVFKGKAIVPTEEHLSCNCSCAIKDKDCDDTLHLYNGSSCKCECRNLDDKRKCEADLSQKYWDTKKCKCMCERVTECSTGYFFSTDSCRCEQQLRTRLRTQNRNSALDTRINRNDYNVLQHHEALFAHPQNN